MTFSSSRPCGRSAISRRTPSSGGAAALTKSARSILTAGGCALLAERECDVILMDELGRMELDAHAFRAAVLAAIHSGHAGARRHQAGHNAFLDEVRAQNGVELFPLTIENREEAPAAIAAWYVRASREKRV